MSVWQILPILSAPMPFQMALDELLFLDPSTDPVFRFYFSYGEWTTVGYSDPEDILDKNNPQNICKRLTGGGQVRHGADLLFSIAASKRHDESFSSVRVSYWKIHEAVKAGVAKLGTELEFFRCDQKLPRGAACFQFPVATDLAFKGRKVAGGAQKRSAGKLLHQESIQIPGLKPEQRLMEAICAGFEEVFKIRFQRGVFQPEMLKAAQVLCLEKYERSVSLKEELQPAGAC